MGDESESEDEPLQLRHQDSFQEESSLWKFHSRIKKTFFRVIMITILAVVVMSGSIISKESFAGEDVCPYNSNTVILLTEFAKGVISVMFILLNRNVPRNNTVVDADDAQSNIDLVHKKWWQHCGSNSLSCLKYGIPGGLYMLGNNVKFYALAYLSPAEFSLLWNFKIVATVCFMVCFLGRKFNFMQRLAIILIIFGVALTEYEDSAGGDEPKANEAENSIVFIDKTKMFGFLITIFGATVNGGANVIIEYFYKSSSDEGFWIKNLKLYAFGVLYNAIPLIIEASLNSQSIEKGFFYGWNIWTVFVVISGSLDGLLIGFLMMFADNVAVIHADVLGTIINVIISAALFGLVITPMFVLAAFFILLSIYLFHMNELKSEETDTNIIYDRIDTNSQSQSEINIS